MSNMILPEVESGLRNRIIERKSRFESDPRKALIRIYDPERATKLAIAELQKQQKKINTQQKALNVTITAVVGVVAVGFIASVIGVLVVFIDSQRDAEKKYSEYIELIEEQKLQINNWSVGEKEIKSAKEGIQNPATTSLQQSN